MYMKRVYLDNAASTAVDKRVVVAMKPYWNEKYANAGGILHKEGLEARAVITKARSALSSYINAQEDEIIFTSGGTEGNNLAIFGVIRELEGEGIPLENMHVVTTGIEHSSVRDIFIYLEKRGVNVSYVPVNSDGVVSVEDVRNEIKDNTVLVSIMMANNEIGTIQPVEEIGKIITAKKDGRELPLYFHTDASQAALFFKINVAKLHADLITFDAQKMYGPKGIGFLYKKRNVTLEPILIGGNQEFGLRPGTPNTPLIVGFYKAFELVEESRELNNNQMTELRDYLILRLEELGGILNGSKVERIPSNVNISFKGIDSEFFIITLSEKGIAASAKSACIGPNTGGSYVVSELGKTEKESSSSVRFSLSKYTTKKELDFTIGKVKEILKKS